ncbi:MAG: NAD-dependent epimerase/dehydratase family protein [Kiloniellaceae bacterium]
MRLSLVTGGSGFIGRHLVQALAERGERVRIFDLRASADLPGRGGSVEFRQGDITDRAAVERAMEGAERVFHLAADPNLWRRDKSSFERINLGGTENVLAAAERQRPDRVVYTSTESILAGLRGAGLTEGGMIDENVTLDVADMPGPYCRSKFLAERAALRAAARGLPVVVVNPTLPVGPGDSLLTPPSRMLVELLNGRIPAYLETAFNMIDVRDVALGHLLAAEHGRAGRRYILGGENLTMTGLLAVLGELSGRPMPRRRVPYWLALAYSAAEEFIADRITGKAPRAPLTGVRLARHAMHFDNGRALTELGLRPRPLRRSLADAIAWFESQQLLEGRPEGGDRAGAAAQAGD